MNYVTVLSHILKESDKRINSPEFKSAYTAENTFVRDRKLSFKNSIYLILSGLRKSLSIEILEFSEKQKELAFHEISNKLFRKHVKIFLMKLLLSYLDYVLRYFMNLI